MKPSIARSRALSSLVAALALSLAASWPAPLRAQESPDDVELEKELSLEAPPDVEPTAPQDAQAEPPPPDGPPVVDPDQTNEPKAAGEPKPKVDPSTEPKIEPPSDSGSGKKEAQADKLPAKRADGSLFDPPNRDMERRLNRIYRKNGEPLSEDKWDALIARQKAEAYRIRPNNTLSGISRSLFGDPKYWPKLWAENGAYENPHLIRPGRRVRFFPGNEEDAPAVMLMDSDRVIGELELPPPAYELDEATLSREESLASSVLDEAEPEKPTIPDPDRPNRKPLDRLPPSFVNTMPEALDRYDATGLEVVKGRAYTTPAQMTPSHYWVDEVPQGAGDVVEIETASEIAGHLQNVFLRLNRAAKVGERFSVVTPDASRSGKFLPSGHVLEVGGVVEVTGPLDEEDRVYRALVIKNVGPIRKGALALEERLPRVDLAKRGPVKNVEAKVLGGHFENDRQVLGAGSVIYLDAGSESGLAVGDLVAVRAKRGSRRPETIYPEAREAIAVAKIAHVQGKGSTAFLLESLDEVRPGDVTGGPLPSRGQFWAIPNRKNVVDVDYEMSRDRARQESSRNFR